MIIPEQINLLYIENDEQTASIISNLLEKSKHTKFDIVNKGTLKDGLSYLKNKCPTCSNCNIDVILLDLVLPNSRGVDTYKSVVEICRDIPIVIISDYEEMACDCVKLGAQDYLLKADINIGIITRSLKYAIERKKIEEALRNSEKRYRDIVEATKAGIYEIDFVNDKFIYVNDVLCELTGWTKEEFLNMGASQILTEESLKDWVGRWEALNRGEYIDEAFEYEIVIKDGSTMWALVTAKFKEDETGMVVGARVIAIDITSAKLAKKEAKHKEELIFNQLEDRIHQWRNEIITTNISSQDTIKNVSMNIQQLTKAEVL